MFKNIKSKQGKSIFVLGFLPHRNGGFQNILFMPNIYTPKIEETTKMKTMINAFVPGITSGLSCVVGIQGDEIGDVKFNNDGDGVGRYSVYQYQHIQEGPNSKLVQCIPVPAHSGGT